MKIALIVAITTDVGNNFTKHNNNKNDNDNNNHNSNNSAEETDQSQVAQPELLLAILLPVAQQIISSLTCTTITTYVSQCVLYVLSSWVVWLVLLLVTQQVTSSLTCTSITTHLSHCVLHILSSWVVLLLVAQHGQCLPDLLKHLSGI